MIREYQDLATHRKCNRLLKEICSKNSFICLDLYTDLRFLILVLRTTTCSYTYIVSSLHDEISSIWPLFFLFLRTNGNPPVILFVVSTFPTKWLSKDTVYTKRIILDTRLLRHVRTKNDSDTIKYTVSAYISYRRDSNRTRLLTPRICSKTEVHIITSRHVLLYEQSLFECPSIVCGGILSSFCSMVAKRTFSSRSITRRCLTLETVGIFWRSVPGRFDIRWSCRVVPQWWQTRCIRCSRCISRCIPIGPRRGSW